MTAKIISFINLKGGVGKTTLALATGEILANKKEYKYFEDIGYELSHKYKVLLIDLDGQSNLTFSVLSENEIDSCWKSNKSTYHFFTSYLTNKTRLRLKDCISNECSNIQDIKGRLHIIPSNFELFDFEEKVMETYEMGLSISLSSLRTALKRALAEEGLLQEYDYIIIDCPPNLSILTANAIIASDYYIVPVIPEKLSTYGLNLIKVRIRELKERYPNDVKIKYAGAILNRVDIRRNNHIELAEEIINDDNFKCFENWVGDVKPLYIVTDYNNGTFYSDYGKYGGSLRRKNPLKSELLYQRGKGRTPSQIRIYQRISGLVEEIIYRVSS